MAKRKASDKTAGQLLKEWRVALGLNQEAFGKMIGVTQSIVSGYEADKRTPHLEQAVRIEDKSEGRIPARMWVAA